MRRLTLKSEALTELTADELTGVAGGATARCVTNQATLCHLCALTPEIWDLTLRSCVDCA